jgi:hypothetical protein
VKNMPLLKALLRQAYERVGVLRYSKIEEIRDYVRHMDLELFKKEVSEIGDVELLRILWSVGLDVEQQKIVLARIEELMKPLT